MPPRDRTLMDVLTDRPVAVAWTVACFAAGVCAEIAHVVAG